MSKKTVIYIAGLSHNGSTLLDFLLSHHPHIIGLGEIYSVITGKTDNLEKTEGVCSCSLELSRCPIWSDCLKKFKESPATGYQNQYRQIIQAISSLKQDCLVDSSKNIRFLDQILPLVANQTIALKIIFLIRDARGWAASYSDIGKKDGQVAKLPIHNLRVWYKDNQTIKRCLDQKKLDYLQISYEELIFNQRETIDRILKFAGLPLEKFSLTNKPNSHIAYGNRMKLTTDSQTINYDSRWLNRYWVNFFFILMPRIFLWNKRNVPLPVYKR